jgi:hypothetical protein
VEILSSGERQARSGRIRLWRSLAMQSRLMAITILGLISAAGLQAQVDQYQVKALFLYNFARYVEWPAQTFASANDSIAICILGRNPFGAGLEQAISGKAVEGRSLVVHEISALPAPCSCHILFVTGSERKRFQSVAAALRESGVLTVGETPGFAKDGGVINFKLEDGKVRFEINVEAAAQERLRISSKLLSLAEIVKQ